MFASSPDPDAAAVDAETLGDALGEGGRFESILSQFASQIASAYRPALAAKQNPRLTPSSNPPSSSPTPWLSSLRGEKALN